MLQQARARWWPASRAKGAVVEHGRQWTLSAQFLLAQLVISVAGMLAIGLLVSRQVQDGVLNRTAAITALYVDSVVAPRLQALATQPRLDAAEVKTLTWLLTSTPLADRIVAYKVWSLQGEVLYSPESQLIGQRFPIDSGLAQAMRGTVNVVMSDLNKPENAAERQHWKRLVEVYVPVRDLGQQRVIAVTEFYQRPDELDAALVAARWRSWAVVAGVTLTMYAVLAGIVRRGSDTIVRQQRALKVQVQELSQLLAQNQRLHERVRQAANRTTTLNEQSLRRIGADLHDGPAQALALALLRLDSVAPDTGDLRPRNPDLATVQKAVRDALAEVRAIAGGLRLPELQPLTLSEVAERAIQVHERRSGTPVSLTIDALPELAPLAVKIALLRSLQEALSNATRHGRGVDVRAHVWVEGDRLNLAVSDEGPGFDPIGVATEGHLGLAGIRERAELLGGGFRIEAAPGRGTRLQMHWPLIEGSEV
ncbi:MAG TPA: sensor histidine kinase [Chloroflexota bacterium]|jgi:signal transduction histidine kinase|nr:sensor histidine kinase [Chloroflexota bacterium]